MSTDRNDSRPRWPSREILARGTGSALRTGLEQLVRRNLRGVWVRGEAPRAGAVWASNHHSWWDFFVALAAMRSVGRSDVGVLMDPQNIGSREIFRAAGAVGTDALRTAIEMLTAGGVLVVFPEGELRPAGPLGPIRPGARWLAQQARVPLVPVAVRVQLRGQQAAEAYLDLGESVDGETTGLAERLAVLDREIAQADPDQPLPGFRQVVSGVRSWHERFGGRMIRS